MNVSLTPELAGFIADLVATGQYRSASEVVRAALRCLQRVEQDDRRKSALQPAHTHTNPPKLVGDYGPS